MIKRKKKSTQQETLLSEAVKTGDIKAVSAILETGAHVNGRNADGSTALFWAARTGACNIVNFLIDQGADVMARDFVGNTASSWAHKNSHHKITQLLALYINGGTGDTPLMKAIEFNYRDFIPDLLKKERNIDIKNVEGNTALMLATYYGHLDLVLLLLERNAELSIQNAQGQTALELAEQRGHTQIAQWLSHYQAVHLGRQGGNTPLMRAAKWGYEDIIPFLLDKENHKEAKNQEGNTALLLAAQYGYQMAVSRLLVGDVELDEQNLHGNTALMLATKNGYYNIAYRLLEAGADLAVKNAKGQTALSFAAMGGYKELVFLLLIKGASIPAMSISWKYRGLAQLISRYQTIGVNVRDSETPLMRAVKKGYFDLAKLWIAKGADLNARNDKNETPLMISVKYGYRDITIALIEKGAQLNLLDNDQMTALNRARQLWFRKKEVNLLIESGATITPRSEEAIALKSRMLPLLESCLNRGNLACALNVYRTCLETYADPALLDRAQAILKKFFLEIPKLNFFKKWLNTLIDFFYPKPALLRAMAKMGDVPSIKSRLAYETLVSSLVLSTAVHHRQNIIEKIIEKSEPRGRNKLRQKLYVEYNLTPPLLINLRNGVKTQEVSQEDISAHSPPSPEVQSKRLSMPF